MEQKKNSFARMGIMIAMVNFMTGFVLTMAQNYASYSYTDLAGISPTMMGTCMFIVNSIAVVITLLSGAIITRSKSKNGQFRPWFLGATVVGLIGGFLIFFNVGNSILLKAIIISIGYLMANSSMDFIYTSNGALLTAMAGADSEKRTKLMGRQWQGGSICYIVSGFAVVPLVTFFCKFTNETVAFVIVQAIFTVIVMIGTIIYYKETKDYDPDNTKSDVRAEESPSFLEMLKAVVANREAVTVLLSDVARFTGYYVLFSMMIYQCTYVIGDMMAMSYVLSASNFCAFVGASIAPKIAEKLGGRKKAVFVFGGITGLAALSIGFFGQTLWGFVISCSAYFFFMSFIDTVDSMLYMDAGEIWLNKTGKDTRPYLFSMYNVSVKIAMALSSIALAALLNIINYTPGMVLDQAGKNTLSWSTAIAPAVGYLLPLVIMLFHRVPDKEVARMIEENAQKAEQ